MRAAFVASSLVSICLVTPTTADGPPQPTRTPILRVVDLDLGEAQQVTLADGKTARIKLLDLKETRDELNHAVRRAEVKVLVNGQEASLVAAMYRLPIEVGGVQVDCTITKGFNANTTVDHWGLAKTARLRLWPKGSPWIEPDSFVYPVKQRWFASGTQMANEPVHVDGGEVPGKQKIYYHSGLDIGGAEALTEVVAATDGLVVSSALETLPGFKDTPAQPRYDVVYLLDDQGWYYRYSHLYSIESAIKPGEKVKKGQKLGLLGKEGGSGGWAHLHFEIVAKQPSGQWGTQEGYAFLWQAYQRQYQPEVTAVARPHHFIAPGDTVVLDATRSRGKSGRTLSYEWTFLDGSHATGATVERKYEKPGMYSEVVKVSDGQGHVDYDFAVVQVANPATPKEVPPTIQAAYWPTFDNHPGEPITFKVRTFRTTDGEETWDFGDGSPAVEVHSDGNARQLAKDGFAVTTHTFTKPGDYLVRVSRTNALGMTATTHLKVFVRAE